jgi:hypothetical protein
MRLASSARVPRAAAAPPSPSSLLAAAPRAARRSYVHAFIRPPFRSAIPSFATHRRDPVKGTVLDSDMNSVQIKLDDFMQQFNDFTGQLHNCSLADTVHVLPELGYFESVRPADLLTGMGDAILPMPLYGLEHRKQELIDMIRFVRSAGAPNDASDILQQVPEAHAIGSDIILLPNGFLVGVTPRTNTSAAGVLMGTHCGKEESKVFPTVAANLPNLNIPMMDIVGFSGQSTIIVWDNAEGAAVAEAVTQKASRPWNFVRIEPGCYFCAFAGGLPRYDVICDADFPRSAEMLQKAGCRVIPINWTEPKKLGLGMRPCVLTLTFAKGGFAGGGVHKHTQYVKKGDDANTHRRGPNGKRRGSEGSPLYGQLVSGELPPPVYQPKPRYQAPMHKVGPPAVISQFDTDATGHVKQKSILEETGGYDWTKEGPDKYKMHDLQEDGRRYRAGWVKR